MSVQRQKCFFLLFCVGGSACEKKKVGEEEAEKFMSLAVVLMDGMNGMESTTHLDKNVFHSGIFENHEPSLR